MTNIRLIARLDIKGKNLVKSIQLEGLRILGSPNEFALDYYAAGIDEIIYMDSVATLYGRSHLGEIISEAIDKIFVPLTVGGGVRSVFDAKSILRCGADKVAINTAAVANPRLISDVAREFGSQCMVSSIDAKKIGHEKWLVCTDNGREKTQLDVIDWAKKCASLGAGEILLTSIDREGTRRGFDLELVKAITSSVNIPIIASGGMGKSEDLIEVVNYGSASAVAMADILHYKRASIPELRENARNAGLEVRDFNDF